MRISQIGLFLSALLTMLFAAIAILNVYYSSGDMVDMALCSFVSWHNSFALITPPLFGNSFFDIHISPIFWLPNIVSWIMPVGQVMLYALCIAGCYALYAAGIFRLWMAEESSEKPAVMAAGVVAALAAAFSAFGMQALRLPHVEMAIPALMLWICIALAGQRYRTAFVCFILCLMVREDAGLHLFGLLTLWAVAARVWKLHFPAQRLLWLYAGVGLAYAVAALIIKNTMFTNGVSNMSFIYAGPDHWGHVTAELLARRLQFFLVERTWITLPFLITLLWAARVRNWLIPLGYIAAIPWAAFNLMAYQEPAGAMGFYYAFPFWFALGWPLAARQFRFDAGRSAGRKPFAAMLLASLIGWQDGGVVVYPLTDANFSGSPFALHETLLHRSETQGFIDYFAAHQDQFDGVAMDTPVMALVLNDNRKMRWLGKWDAVQPAAMIYYDEGYEFGRLVAPRLAAGDYAYFYEVRGTKIRMASRGPVEQVLPGAEVFRITERPSF